MRMGGKVVGGHERLGWDEGWIGGGSGSGNGVIPWWHRGVMVAWAEDEGLEWISKSCFIHEEQLEKSDWECEQRAALAAASDPYRYVEKRKPIPDPQETGLIYGNKNRTNKSED
ncbi:hypothetical protein Acr_04g0010700 [Actinidia rufa]|uniref:Uncharacterized protein n=1 Tax=Actinidia rufa TaxID=165716 RepID=A0A7J0EJ74_9ERIC|nr:hypothetical protein Acr_04g0010700 [Actinidia rufa]